MTPRASSSHWYATAVCSSILCQEVSRGSSTSRSYIQRRLWLQATSRSSSSKARSEPDIQLGQWSTQESPSSWVRSRPQKDTSTTVLWSAHSDGCQATAGALGELPTLTVVPGGLFGCAGCLEWSRPDRPLPRRCPLLWPARRVGCPDSDHRTTRAVFLPIVALGLMEAPLSIVDVVHRGSKRTTSSRFPGVTEVGPSPAGLGRGPCHPPAADRRPLAVWPAPLLSGWDRLVVRTDCPVRCRDGGTLRHLGNNGQTARTDRWFTNPGVKQ